ncbi:hypothetical protein DFH06DRAFT_1430775 [Mycena polygramma]|nr:hypothetical protein DFH06DRAFT_1430775 [Mycena polygramma]
MQESHQADRTQPPRRAAQGGWQWKEEKQEAEKRDRGDTQMQTTLAANRHHWQNQPSTQSRPPAGHALQGMASPHATSTSTASAAQQRLIPANIKAKIAQYKNDLAALEKAQEEVGESLTLVNYPVNSLPPEILSLIFVACLPRGRRVRRWRSVVGPLSIQKHVYIPPDDPRIRRLLR